MSETDIKNRPRAACGRYRLRDPGFFKRLMIAVAFSVALGLTGAFADVLILACLPSGTWGDVFACFSLLFLIALVLQYLLCVHRTRKMLEFESLVRKFDDLWRQGRI